MQKEIFEQPESVVNTMRGRVRFEQGKGQSVISDPDTLEIEKSVLISEVS